MRLTTKTGLTAALATLLLMPPLASGAGKGSGGRNGGGGHILIDYIASLPLQDLSQVEIDGLKFMREEEKLARDVYQVMWDLWGLPAFQNIKSSEQQHMDFVKLLLDRYNLDDPVTDDSTGSFSDVLFTELFEEFVDIGSRSPIDALYVGATIEDLDLSDLADALLTTDNDDIGAIYQNLLKGSRNHMRSFNSLLENAGVDYLPQFISQDEFEAVVVSPREVRVVYDENGDILWQGGPGSGKDAKQNQKRQQKKGGGGNGKGK